MSTKLDNFIDSGLEFFSDASQEINKKVMQASTLVGRGLLHSLYPNDIEFYFMALEVLDANLNTIFYFPFPVNPTLYRTSVVPKTNIAINHAGININRRKAFIPKEIQIAGSFGRKYQVAFPNLVTIGTNVTISIDQSNLEIGNEPVPGKYEKMIMKSLKNYTKTVRQNGSYLDIEIKNGFGICRVLEGILTQVYSNNSDNGFGVKGEKSPYLLVLYNSFTNDNFIVEPGPFSFPHSIQRNMIYDYEMSFTAVAPLSSIISDSEKIIKKRNQQGSLAKAAAKLGNTVLTSAQGAVVKNIIGSENPSISQTLSSVASSTLNRPVNLR